MMSIHERSLRLHWLPFIVLSIMVITLFGLYMWSVYEEHVKPLIPMVSWLANHSPGSNIFSLACNIIAILGIVSYIGLFIYINKMDESRKCKWLNLVALILSVFQIIGTSIVGTFGEAETDNMHYLGAILSVGIGGVYNAMLVVMSYKLRPHLGSSLICHIRLAFIANQFVMMVIGGLLFLFARKRYDGNYMPMWNNDNKGYYLHVVSTFLEWITIISQPIFFCTFVSTLKKLKLGPIVVIDEERTNHIECHTFQNNQF